MTNPQATKDEGETLMPKHSKYSSLGKYLKHSPKGAYFDDLPAEVLYALINKEKAKAEEERDKWWTDFCVIYSELLIKGAKSKSKAQPAKDKE